MFRTSARKQHLYSAPSCGIVGPTRVNTSVGVDHKHATNDFYIAPRLAESSAHSMDGPWTV